MAKLEHNNIFKPAVPAQETVSQGSENDLRSLIELGSIIDSVRISDKVFELKTLSAYERLILSKSLKDDITVEEMFDFNIRLLSSVIVSINGKTLETYHPNYNAQLDESQYMSLKCDIISRLQPPVINKLLNFYDGLTKRSESQFETEQVKN